MGGRPDKMLPDLPAHEVRAEDPADEVLVRLLVLLAAERCRRDAFLARIFAAIDCPGAALWASAAVGDGCCDSPLNSVTETCEAMAGSELLADILSERTLIDVRPAVRAGRGRGGE